MNGLSANVDLTPLSGVRVIQLCFGENELQLRFDTGARAVVESVVVYRDAAALELRTSKYSEAAAVLCRMLGQQVLSAARETDGGLYLRFENGDELRILNDSAKYESFQLHIAGQTHVG